jgi:hypothetical protein
MYSDGIEQRTWLSSRSVKAECCGKCGTGVDLFWMFRFSPAKHHSTNVKYSTIIALINRGWLNRLIRGCSTKEPSLTQSPSVIIKTCFSFHRPKLDSNQLSEEQLIPGWIRFSARTFTALSLICLIRMVDWISRRVGYSLDPCFQHFVTLKAMSSNLEGRGCNNFYLGVCIRQELIDSISNPLSSFWVITIFLGLKVLTSVSTKMDVFWVVAPRSLVEVCQRFRGPCCLHHQGDK